MFKFHALAEVLGGLAAILGGHEPASPCGRADGGLPAGAGLELGEECHERRGHVWDGMQIGHGKPTGYPNNRPNLLPIQ